MNYYDIIGVKPTASAEDISAAHKALAKQYHPDVNSSKDAHEKMIRLNEANEILSDSTKREKYDNELKQNQRVSLNRSAVSHSPQTAGANPPQAAKSTEIRTNHAEIMRKRTEKRLRTEEAARALREEHARRKAEENAKKNRQAKVDFDKQHLIDVLSALVMDGNTKQINKKDVNIEQHHATKVLLSLIRNNDNHLRQIAEEKERKQRIDEILYLVKEYNNKEDKMV